MRNLLCSFRAIAFNCDGNSSLNLHGLIIPLMACTVNYLVEGITVISQRRFHVYPLRPATISTDAIILLLVFFAGYGVASFLERRRWI